MAARPLLTVESYRSDRGVVLRLVGDLDLSTISQLERAADGFAADGRSELTLDMSGVRFLDSTGLRALLTLTAAAEAREGRVVIVDPSEQVTKLVRLAGIEGVLSFGTGVPEPEPEA